MKRFILISVALIGLLLTTSSCFSPMGYYSNDSYRDNGSYDNLHPNTHTTDYYRNNISAPAAYYK